MKKIEAIIRTSKFEEVHSELGKIGIAFFTFSEVKGIGTEHAANDKADAVVQCILKSAHTGKVGDGKIFVSDINEVYRIRNADKGNEAL